MITMAEEQAPPKAPAPAAQPQAQQPQRQQAPTPPQALQGPQFAGFLAEIVEIREDVKTGIYGEIYTVSCRILEGKDKGRIIRRNMIGPVKTGDIVRLPDTSREAREIKVK